MANRRRLAPHSPDFNARLIERRQELFSKGMFRQQDTEGTDIPEGGLADIINARCCGSYIEGRPGSLLFNPADFGFLKSATSEAISTSFQSGEIYEANGDAVPAVNDLFMTYGENDWSGNDLATAKGSTPRKWDIFQITNNSVGYEAIKYRGNIRNPAIPGYTGITASKAGTTITATSAVFDVSVVGTYFAWYDGTRDLIDQFLSTTTVRVRSSGTHASAARCELHAKMNASLYHKSANRIVALFGRRVYVSSVIPFTGWTEVPGLVKLYERPSNTSETIIRQFNDDAIIINPLGIYRVKLTGNCLYYWRTNSAIPTTKISDTDPAGNYRHRYNYVYTMSRITGITYQANRLATDNKSVVEQETAPVAIDDERIDYGAVLSEEPVGDGATTYGRIVGTTLDNADMVVTAWNIITDAAFSLTVNSVRYDFSVDLTSATTLPDVALLLQNAIRLIEDLADIIVEFDADHFVFKTGEGDSFTASANSGTGGTNISDNLKIFGVTPTTPIATTPLSVGYLTYPTNGNHLTHYSPYRTEDLDKLNNGDPGLMALVDDIPVLKPFTANLDTSILTLTNGATLSQQDIGCTVYAINGYSFTILSLTSDTVAVTDADPSILLRPPTNNRMVIGGYTVFAGSQSGTAIVVSGATADWVGKQIFWEDGGLSIVKEYVSPTSLTAVNSANHATQAAAVDPISRSFSDTVSDVKLGARFSAYPLRTRFQVPLPGGSVGEVTPNFLFTASRGLNTFYYCDIQYNWMIGFYHPAFQKNNDIWDGVQAIIVNDGFVLIRGLATIYMQSLLNYFDVGDNTLGESVNKLTALKVINENFGSIGAGASQKIGLGQELFITSEPGVRTFDGSSFGDNFTLGRIQRSDFNKLKQAYVAGYNAICGEFIWGIQEE